MQTVARGYQGFAFFMQLNADRIFTLGTVLVGLMAGAFLGSAILNP